MSFKILKNEEPLRWWLNKTEASWWETTMIEEDYDFISKINGDLNDFETPRVEDKLDNYYSIVNEIFNLMGDCNIKSMNYELLLQKRATIHIQELFEKYVDDETLVIVSSFQHISAEREIVKCKNLFNLDEENDDSSFKYKIDEAITEAKKYKKVFVYVIGTEFESGRRHNNCVYKELHDKLKENSIENIMVLDAVQEMFLYPRDYSFYHYIIGTVHSLYYLFDTGLLFINRQLVYDKDIKTFTGYRRSDVLYKIYLGLKMALERKPYILMYNNVINDSIDHHLFEGFKEHKSMPNFWSVYKSGRFLEDNMVQKYIDDVFVKHSLYKDPGFNLEISHHKPEKELFIRVRAQTMMFFPTEVEEKMNWFYDNYCKLAKLAIMTLEKD